MKKVLISLIFILVCNAYTYSQLVEAIAECNNLLEQDIKTKFSSYNRTVAKQWFYEYFKSSEEKRKSMKKDRKDDFGFKVAVDGIPLGGDGSFSSTSAKDVFSKLEFEAKNEAYVSDENLALLITTFVPNEAFNSYNKCLELAGSILLNNSAGVKISIASQTEDIIVLKLEFNSSPAGQTITIDNADYSGGDALYGKKLIPGKVIKDRQIIYEQIKRVQAQDLTITINFKEGPGVTSTIESKTKRSQETSIPIGTIISSLLPYEAFMEVNKFKKTSNLKLLTWAPCDGRVIASSLFAENGGGNEAPDLRGVFLRGINDFQVPGGGPIKNERLNPALMIAGQFQPDALQEHAHNFRMANGYDRRGQVDVISSAIHPGGNGDTGLYTPNNGHSKMKLSPSPNANSPLNYDIETRPKNVTVYYYIKIN